MKLKALFLALAVAGAGASFALAEGNPGSTTTGSSTTTGATTTGSATTGSTTTASTPTNGCRRFELHGTLVSVAATSFSVTVIKAGKAASGAAGTPVTIGFDADTRVSWSGRGTLSGPNAGDSLHVNGKKCGDAYTASKVQARGPKQHGSDENGQQEHK